MIDALSVWKDELENLPKVADLSWALNFANYVGDRVANIETDPTKLSDANLVFVFNRPVFAAALMALPPTTDPIIGIAGFAAAWETAILTSIYPATLNVSAGAKKNGSPAPPNVFSSITSVILNPASIIAGKAKIMELVTAPQVMSAQDSEFPVKFREAFLLLTITVTGLNSVDAPAPLSAPLVPLI